MRPNQYHAYRLLEREHPAHAKTMLRGLYRTSVDELTTGRQPPPPYDNTKKSNALALLRRLLRRFPARKALEEMATFKTIPGRYDTYAVRLLRRLSKCTS